MKESEIRKREAHETYLNLVKADCERIFKEPGSTVPGNCPACGSDRFTLQFVKQGFEYGTCDQCQTLYAHNRPTLEKLNQFYSESESTAYWINSFFKPVAEVRREKIFLPRAEYFTQKFGGDPQWTIGDIGAGFGIFMDELRKLWPKSTYVAIEPSVAQFEICKGLGFQAECSMLEDLKGYDEQFDLLTGFELLEHLSDPRDFLTKTYRLLKPGGLLWLTTLNGQGFDIQVLWENSKSIFPPCHVNFFNPDSLTQLVTEVGFEVLEVETPGQLDWNIVEERIKNENSHPGRFWEMLAERGDDEAKKAFQEWIRKYKFSSHMRILARK